MPPSTIAPTRRETTAHTRRRILAQAAEVFSEQGFEGASTRLIAARAEVTQPLLNYHFSSKDELWRTSVGELFATLTETLGGRLAGLRGVDDLQTARLLVREFVRFSAHHPQLHRIITQECKVDGPRMDWLVERHIRPLYDDVISRFAALADRGLMRRLPPAHVYYILTGAAPTIFVLAPECRRLTGIDPSGDDVIETHADIVCDLIFSI